MHAISHPELFHTTVTYALTAPTPKPDEFFGTLLNKIAEPVPTWTTPTFELVPRSELSCTDALSKWLDELATKMGLESNWREVKSLPMGHHEPMPVESLGCWVCGVEPAHKTYAFDYPAFECAETQARRATRIAWEIEAGKREAQPTVCEVEEIDPIVHRMNGLEDRGLLHGEHNGAEWEMEPGDLARVAALPSYGEALRYVQAHRRWITEKAMSTNGDFRSFKEILDKSRMF